MCCCCFFSCGMKEAILCITDSHSFVRLVCVLLGRNDFFLFFLFSCIGIIDINYIQLNVYYGDCV